MKTLKITLDYLRRSGACEDAQEVFADIFPDGVEVTEELAAHHADDFDWMWARNHLLQGEHRIRARDEFFAVIDERNDGLEVAKKEYENAGGRGNDSALRRFWAERDRIMSLLKIEHARIFACHFIAQGGREIMEGEES